MESRKFRRWLLIFIFYFVGIFLSYSIDKNKGVYVFLLFILCTYSLCKSYIRDGILYIFKPINFFLLNYFYIFGIGYFAYLGRAALDISIYDHKETTVVYAQMWSIGALLFLLFAYKIIRSLKLKRKKYKRESNSENNKNVVRIWIILLLAVIFSFLIFWGAMGVIPFFSPGFHDYGRTELGKGLGLLEGFSKSLLNATLIHYIWQFKRYKKIKKFTICYFIFCAAIFILNDDRGGMVGYCMCLAFIYYFCVHPLSIKLLAIGFASIVLFAGTIGVIRALGTESKSSELAIVLSSEMSIEFDNYVEVFNMFDNRNGLGGSTIVPVFTIPIPRAIFPEKEKYKTAGEYFKDYHNHDHIRIGERLTYVGELYMNWGRIGIIIGMIIMGVILGWLSDASKYLMSSSSIYIYIQTIISVTSFIAGDIASVVVNFIMTNMIIIMYVILKRVHIFDC